MRTHRVPLPDTVVEVREVDPVGPAAGRPLLLAQTGLGADELLPLALQPALAHRRRLLPHRRGYGASGPSRAAGSIAAEASDAAALLVAVDAAPAHVVGYSFSAAVALELAVLAPDLVASLTLVEPPPTITAHRDEFIDVNQRLLALRADDGLEAALNAFWELAAEAGWWQALEAVVPDARAQALRDAATFFDHDLPALLDWTFTGADAAAVTCPVLHVGAADSGPWWSEVRSVVRAWFPGAVDVVVPGADHGLVVSHAAEVAVAVSRFVGDVD